MLLSSCRRAARHGNGDHAHVGGRAISDFAHFCFAGCRESVADSGAGTRTGARSDNGGAGRAGGRAIATIQLGVRLALVPVGVSAPRRRGAPCG
jgi:hypothetical protein